MDAHATTTLPALLVAAMLLPGCASIDSKGKVTSPTIGGLPELTAGYDALMADDIGIALAGLESYFSDGVSVRSNRSGLGEQVTAHLKALGVATAMGGPLYIVASNDHRGVSMQATFRNMQLSKTYGSSYAPGGVEIAMIREPDNIADSDWRHTSVGDGDLEVIVPANPIAGSSVSSGTGNRLSRDSINIKRNDTVAHQGATPFRVIPMVDSPREIDGDILEEKVRKRNLFDTDVSNYSDVYLDYKNILRDTLVFANDSLHLGIENKRLIASFLDTFNAETDIVSIVGCSHGKSALSGGNETLAKGRAERVKEELLISGVAVDAIFDEVCWSTEYHATMPKRGVIITLKRKNTLG